MEKGTPLVRGPEKKAIECSPKQKREGNPLEGIHLQVRVYQFIECSEEGGELHTHNRGKRKFDRQSKRLRFSPS